MFFSEEKNQKTFISQQYGLSGHGRHLGTGGEAKVFCFFSSEKKRFPLFSLPGQITDVRHYEDQVLRRLAAVRPAGFVEKSRSSRCLAASTPVAPARDLINLHARHWGIESELRDDKDIRFGMGMGSMHVSSPERRDRLWLICAFAVALPTLLGAAGCSGPYKMRGVVRVGRG